MYEKGQSDRLQMRMRQDPRAPHPRAGKSTSQRRRLATQSTNLHSPCFSPASVVSFSCSHPPISRLAPPNILRLLSRGRDKSQGFPLFEGFRCSEILGPSTRHVYTRTHRVYACARLVGDLTDCACAIPGLRMRSRRAASVFQTEHGT